MACIESTRGAFDYVVAFIPIMLTSAIAYVAWRQWRTNKEKLRLDLYERRFTVYEETLAYYQALMRECEPEELKEHLKELRSLGSKFIKSYREAQFLFSKDSGVFSTLVKIKDQFNIVKNKMTGMPEAVSGLEKSLIELERAISPYLNFHEVTGYGWRRRRILWVLALIATIAILIAAWTSVLGGA